jgi:hypothetical protein
MEQNNVLAFENPGRFSDSLTVLLRRGASKLLASAIEAEVLEFLERRRPVSVKGVVSWFHAASLRGLSFFSGLSQTVAGSFQFRVPRVHRWGGFPETASGEASPPCAQ